MIFPAYLDTEDEWSVEMSGNEIEMLTVSSPVKPFSQKSVTIT